MFEFCYSFAMDSSVLCTIIEVLLHWVAQSGVLSWLLVAVFMHLGCGDRPPPRSPSLLSVKDSAHNGKTYTLVPSTLPRLM